MHIYSEQVIQKITFTSALNEVVHVKNCPFITGFLVLG